MLAANERGRCYDVPPVQEEFVFCRCFPDRDNGSCGTFYGIERFGCGINFTLVANGERHGWHGDHANYRIYGNRNNWSEVIQHYSAVAYRLDDELYNWGYIRNSNSFFDGNDLYGHGIRWFNFGNRDSVDHDFSGFSNARFGNTTVTVDKWEGWNRNYPVSGTDRHGDDRNEVVQYYSVIAGRFDDERYNWGYLGNAFDRCEFGGLHHYAG